ncbi:hypothetical protein LXL04_002462 [Taraxacum kok-saghyz]
MYLNGLSVTSESLVVAVPQLLFPKQAASTSLNGKSENPMKINMVEANNVENKMMNMKKLGDFGAGSPCNLIPNTNVDSTPSPPFYAFDECGFRGRRRCGTLEKVVERRVRRMIKN